MPSVPTTSQITLEKPPSYGWSEWQIATLCRLHAEGCTDREIAEQISKTLAAVSGVRRANQIAANLPPVDLPAAREDEARRLYARGFTDAEIASAMRLTKAAVFNFRRRANLIQRTKTPKVESLNDVLERQVVSEERAFNAFWRNAARASDSYLSDLVKEGYTPLTDYVESDPGRVIPMRHVEHFSSVGSAAAMCSG